MVLPTTCLPYTLSFLDQKTTTAGFEPTLPEGNCLAGNRLNHSATLSFDISHVNPLVPLNSMSFPIENFAKTTVAGFEPTHPEDN